MEGFGGGIMTWWQRLKLVLFNSTPPGCVSEEEDLLEEEKVRERWAEQHPEEARELKRSANLASAEAMLEIGLDRHMVVILYGEEVTAEAERHLEQRQKSR